MCEWNSSFLRRTFNLITRLILPKSKRWFESQALRHYDISSNDFCSHYQRPAQPVLVSLVGSLLSVNKRFLWAISFQSLLKLWQQQSTDAIICHVLEDPIQNYIVVQAFVQLSKGNIELTQHRLLVPWSSTCVFWYYTGGAMSQSISLFNVNTALGL
jgi:hypothetical protein